MHELCKIAVQNTLMLPTLSGCNYLSYCRILDCLVKHAVYLGVPVHTWVSITGGLEGVF